MYINALGEERGERQMLHGGIIMAISKLKSTDITQYNSIYYYSIINVQAQSLICHALVICLPLLLRGS